ncbi:hypothetical protein PFISCL1PPCAC_13837, partial [Pristionchus fissidentatus]
MTVLSKTAFPLAVCTIPAFAFFSVYALFPADSMECHELRIISVAMYDQWLAIISVVIVLCLPYYEPRFVCNLRC